LLQKILLDQKLANLSMQILDMRFIALLALFCLARKRCDNTFLGLSFPRGDLIGVDAILAG